MKNTITSLLLIGAATIAFGQNSNLKWSVSADQMPGHIKAFQENKGQFINTVNDWPISYGADCGGTDILFTPKGILYCIPERVKMTPEEVEEAEKKESAAQAEQEHETKYKTVYHNVTAEWVGANANATIEAIDKTPYYFGSVNPTKAEGINNISGFKEIVYHDIYPGIDIDFTFHPQQGIKYSLRLKPGCDASLFKMHFSGQDGMLIDAEGNVHIKTPMGDIIDHAPVTKQDTREVASAFKQVNNNEVAFKLGAANKTSAVVIDPWITAVTDTMIATDIGVDSLNNAYVQEWKKGNMYVQKYNSIGVLQWTYSVTQYGKENDNSDMAVDPSGNVYLPQSYYYTNGGGGSYALICLNKTGTLKYFYNSYAGTTIFETWNMEYSTKYAKLVEAGSPTILQHQVAIVNAANGNLNGAVKIDTGSSEIYAGTIAPNGNYYGLTANHCFCYSGAGSYQQHIVAYDISGNTAAPLWNTRIHTYNQQDFETKNLAGIAANDIGASAFYIYTSDGVNAYQFDINTGALLDSTKITGGSNSSYSNSGVVADTCSGDVYIGNHKSVMVYTANLSFITSYATPSIVYDIAVSDGLVWACGADSAGNGFVAQYTAQPCLPTGINNTSADNTEFNVYPNPSSGIYTVAWSGGKNGTRMEVYNTIGQLVLSKALSANQNTASLDLSAYPGGAYCIRLTDGQNTMTKTIIKK